MSGYLLLVESFYYGLTQIALDDYQDYLIKLRNIPEGKDFENLLQTVLLPKVKLQYR
jgi:hypothetical protein